ncbi:MAG: hypothetical protein WC373_15245 [Smithella sp.]|jgi:8-oxo-dGTP pyrophosphatase MutT (NUDIX family)
MSKDGRVVLLAPEHFGATNSWGQPVVGWVPNSQGIGGLHNPRGYGLVRVVLQKLVDGAMQFLYDQPIIVENAGSIVLAQLGDRVGLVQNFRMVGDRLLPDAGAEYIKRLQEERLWSKLLETLGRWHWEAPRGLAPSSKRDDEDFESFVLRTAKLEALEEAGLGIEKARIVGRVNANPTFFPHAQYVVHAQIASVGDAVPENLEIIGNMHLFTRQELRRLNDAGEFDDGLTLAALALCEFVF